MSDKPTTLIAEAASWVELELGNVTKKIKLKPAIAQKLDNGTVPVAFRVDHNGNPSGGQTTDRHLYLFDKEKYAHIQRYQSETRREHNKRTIPDGRRGKDIITSRSMAGVGMNGKAYDDWLVDRKIELEPLARDFAYNTYPILVQEAKTALSPIWEDIKKSYPTPDQIFESISMKWDFTEIPVGKQWSKMKDLPVELRKKMEAQAQSRVNVIARDFSIKVADKIKDHMSKFSSTMTAKGKCGKDGFRRFSQTLVDGVTDLAESLEALNYDSNEVLTEIQKDLKELTQDGNLTKDAITGGGEQFREDLKDEADSILKKVEKFKSQLA